MKGPSEHRFDGPPDAPALLVVDIARLYRAAFDSHMKSLDLGRSEWRLIGFLQRFEGHTQQELAEAMDFTPGGMGKLIDRLESEGLVARRFDADDRRSRHVHLTERARPLAEEVDGQSRRLVARALAALSAEEVGLLVQLLSKMRDGFAEVVSG